MARQAKASMRGIDGVRETGRADRMVQTRPCASSRGAKHRPSKADLATLPALRGQPAESNHNACLNRAALARPRAKLRPRLEKSVTNQDENPQEPAFARILQEAAELQEDDFEGALRMTRKCKEAGLTRAETMMVLHVAEKATGIHSAVIRSMQAQVETEHPEHGALATPVQAAEALRTELEAEFGPLMHTEGSLWAYQATAADPLHGIWSLLPLDKLERRLRRTFPYAVVATAGKRSEIIAHLHAMTHEEDGFGEAEAGLCLSDVFLRYDPDDHTLEPYEHAAGNGARTKLPVALDEHATAHVFEAKLLRTFGGDLVKMRCFLEFLGCAVFGRMPSLNLVTTCVVLVGPQRSGKSTVLRLAESFFREEQIAHLAPDLWGEAEHLAQLAGRSVNTITELQTKKKLKGNIIKQLLSHEPVTVRRLYGNSFTAVLRCTNWWACNELPKLDETHPSLMRRFIVLSMGETLTDDEATEDFWSIYEAERAGVINLVARSFLEVMERGHFLPPPDSDALVAKMQFGEDVVPMFARVRLEARPGSRLTTDQLRKALCAFALEQGVDLGAGSLSGPLKQLASIMRDQLGAVRKKTNGNPFYLGVALKGGTPSAVNDVDPDEPDAARAVDLGDL
jgi:hypothetical protein